MSTYGMTKEARIRLRELKDQAAARRKANLAWEVAEWHANKDAYHAIQKLISKSRGIKGTLPAYPRSAFREALKRIFADYFDWHPEVSALYWSLDRVVAYMHNREPDLMEALVNQLGMRTMADYVRGLADEKFLNIGFRSGFSDDLTIPRFTSEQPQQQ